MSKKKSTKMMKKTFKKKFINYYCLKKSNYTHKEIMNKFLKMIMMNKDRKK